MTRRTMLIVGFCLCPVLARAQVRAGAEFRVNTYTTAPQAAPALAFDARGDFIVVWSSYGQDGVPGSAIMGQRFDASATPQGAEFEVNTYTTQWQAYPAVARAPDGRFVVVWTSYTHFGSTYGVIGQRFDASGRPQGAEFVVNIYTTAQNQLPSVAMAPDGRFVVVWQSGQNGINFGVYGRLFDASGAPRGGEFSVNTSLATQEKYPAVTMTPSGSFIVVWNTSQDGSQDGVAARRYNASGTALGGEFIVNTYTSSSQEDPLIASEGTGTFVVVWDGYADGSNGGVFGQRFDAAGARRGGQFQVNTYTTYPQFLRRSSVMGMDAAGNFVVAWISFNPNGSDRGVFGQRFDAAGARRGGEFQVSTATTTVHRHALVASDRSGNFVSAWYSDDGSDVGVFGQRYGGLGPAGLAVEDGANDVVEPADTFRLVTSWRNVTGAAQAIQGRSSSGVVPAGLSLTLSPASDYGTVPSGGTGACASCFTGGLTGTRPTGHVDARFTETLQPDVQGQTNQWVLHVGESFTDVPRVSPYYRFVETLLHRGVTTGCAVGAYCPADPTTREQMSAFVLVGKEGGGFTPPACTVPGFADVPASSPFCRWIEELARRGVTAGCGGGNYCPSAAVTREQMAVFVLRTLDPTLSPPACTTPRFDDVPASSPFCRWIEELARRGVVAGCSPNLYCPSAPVTREQMGVFLTVTFGLALYGS